MGEYLRSLLLRDLVTVVGHRNSEPIGYRCNADGLLIYIRVDHRAINRFQGQRAEMVRNAQAADIGDSAPVIKLMPMSQFQHLAG